jgi:hypothetical protein
LVFGDGLLAIADDWGAWSGAHGAAGADNSQPSCGLRRRVEVGSEVRFAGMVGWGFGLGFGVRCAGLKVSAGEPWPSDLS